MQEKFIPENQAKVTVKKVTIEKRIDMEFKRIKRNIEDSLIKMNFLPGLASALNNSRVTNIVKNVRNEVKFDLAYHLRHQDTSGKTEGCGCVYCKVHHQYVKYKRLYSIVKAKYEKRNGVAIVPDKVEANNLVSTSIMSHVISAYYDEMVVYKEKYLKYKTLRKKLSKALKIPEV